MAEELDAADPLAAFRERFVIADPELIYLDGNSLGPLPAATPEVLREVVEEGWGGDWCGRGRAGSTGAPGSATASPSTYWAPHPARW